MLATAFTLLGTAVSWLELLAFILALACVIGDVFEVHWAWPLAFISSGLYCWLFYASRIYGDAVVQIFFAVTAIWGWWQWLFGQRTPAQQSAQTKRGKLHVARLDKRQVLIVVLLWLLLWPLLGWLLARYTDTDIAYFNGFTTAGNILGTVLLARKYIENWSVWIVVDVLSTGLFAFKALWLTAVLYAIFTVIAVAGQQRWSRQMNLQ